MSTKLNDYVCHKCYKVYKSKGKGFVNTVSSLEKENCSIACILCDTKYITLRSLIHHVMHIMCV